MPEELWVEETLQYGIPLALKSESWHLAMASMVR